MNISYSVSLLFANHEDLSGEALQLCQTGDGVYEGASGQISVRLVTGRQIALHITNHSGKAISAARWCMRCSEPRAACCRVLLSCSDVRNSGIIQLKEKMPDCSLMTGLLYGADQPCMLLGTKLPQNNVHLYQVHRIDDDTVEITGKTEFTVGQSVMESLSTEVTYALWAETPLNAMQAYASHIPDLKHVADPIVGWNSWDYYFTTVSSQAVRENLEFIKNDPILNGKIQAIVVDDGWETCVGEWYANHRFPEGLSYLAELIKSYGMIPGIWTNGAQTESLCEPALRHPEYYIPDEFGIPFTVDGKQVLDPTHPAAQTFILDTYTRLYQAGFRIFKVDFISTIANGKRFYDPSCGPYEAIRRLLRLIRQAVGDDSHIVGCSFPVECGAGLVDSSRISVDIHNHWPHVQWIMEYMQARFWCNGKLFRSDPDMLIVRGSETSLEKETNVFNPWNLVPPGEDRFSSRWRRGPLFHALEAETWANLVVFSGGDIMLGDRLCMLNDRGLELVYSHLEPHLYGAVPLDLGDRETSELWYDSHTASVLIVNTEDQTRDMVLDFARYGLSIPQNVITNRTCWYENGIFRVILQPHASAVVELKY